jgi:heat shock protein HtpX
VLDPQIRQRQKARNALQTLLLLGSLVLVAAALAWLLFGTTGLVWMLIAGGVVLLVRPRIPTRTLLAMYGAVPLPPEYVPGLHQAVQVFAERAGLRSVPVLYYVRSRVPNAFATGRGDDAALAVTDGLLRHLTAREVVGVLAHEVSHVRAGDTTVMSLSDAISRFAQMLAYLGMFSIIFTLPFTFAGDARLLLFSLVLIALPYVVTLLQLALSRSREFDADLAGAGLTGDPEGLASALESLERSAGRIWERTMLPRGRLPDPLVLRTHPATEERTRRLRELVPRDRQRWLGPAEPTPPAGHAHVPGSPRLRFPGIRW